MLKGYISFPKLTLSLLTINLFLIIFIYSIQSLLPPILPVFYGAAKGEEQLRPFLYLITPNLIAFFFILLNTLLIKFIKTIFFHQILLATDIAITILASITVLKIIFLVGNI